MTKSALILGGTGQIGRAAAARLLAEGWAVTLASRSGNGAPHELTAAGARMARFERNDDASLAALLANGTDALIDTIAFDKTHADQLLKVQSDVGTLVVISSIAVYCDSQGRNLDEAGEPGTFPIILESIPETHPTVRPGSATYASRKMAMEETLLERSRRPLFILRPGAIHGVGSKHPREWWFVKRLLDGRRRIPLAYGGALGLHTAAAVNIASLISTVLPLKSTIILNAVDPAPPTVLDIGQQLAGLLRRDVDFIGLAVSDSQSPVGATPWSLPVPFIASDASAKALGYAPAASYRSAIEPLCDWLVATAADGDWRARFPIMAASGHDPFDYRAEDDLLGLLTGGDTSAAR